MAERLTAKRWREIAEILDKLVELPVDRRADRLQALCSEDPELHAQIGSLLEAEKRGSLLDAPADEYLATLVREMNGGGDDGEGAPHSGAEKETRFLPGTVLAGRYRIATRLGRGGMGEVFRADDMKLGQTVALKFLPVELASDEELNARFLEEIKLARQISHPNVCRVYDVGEVEGQLFLSMEFIEGEDLASLLKRIGRLPEEKATQIAQQLCAGLAAAHEQGILHRDLKPGNVMLDERGRVRITDFGLAGFAGEIRGGEVLAGTPVYMAPEQLAGESVSIQSDLYALGLLLYKLFTGRRPYEGESRAELLEVRQEAAPPAPSSWVQGLDPVIEKVILRCLEADPSERPVSARAVAAALPGGDPLAAALESGETPSPELVAAAGPRGVIRPRTALVCMAVLVAGLLFEAHWRIKSSVVGLVPWTKPATALVSDARQLLAELGYTEPPRDSAWRFVADNEYIDHLKRTDRTPGRWRHLEQPGQLAFRFVYRQAPYVLAPLAWSGRPQFAVPGYNSWEEPAAEPGDLQLVTDLRGRLRYLRAVSAREDPPSSSGEADGAERLFEVAGLDLASFEVTEPVGALPVFAERRLAWSGILEEIGGLPVRVEAAFVGARPVFFECVYSFRSYWGPPAKAPGSTGEKAAGEGRSWKSALWMLLVVAVLAPPLFLALRNLRSGRGDRRGAMRLAAAVFLVRFCWWILAGHHVTDWWMELFGLLGSALARSLFVATAAWVLYVAIEPYARRLWPTALVSWSRLLDGRIRDPLVGRDALFGFLITTASAPLGLLYFHVPRWLSWPEPPMPMPHPLWPIFAPSADPLLGSRDAIAAVGSALMGGLWVTLGLLALLIALLALVRKRWLAIALLILFLGPTHWSFAFSDFHWLGIVIGLLWGAIYCWIFVRFGLLTLTVSNFTAVLFWVSPVTDDPALPFFGTSLLALAVVAALAAYAAWTAAGRRHWLQVRGAAPVPG